MFDVIVQAIVLGIVQGLTEFLPVSSTAHLIIIPFLLGWKDPGLTFDVALHLGTLIAVVVYFRKDIILLIKGFIEFFTKKNDDIYQKLSIYIFLSTIPAGICGILFEKKIETVLRSPFVIVINLIGLGIILWAVDYLCKSNKKIENMKFPEAFTIGIAQAMALIPGVSRSGITMTAGRILGFTRETAARFSFLLGIPIIAAGSVFSLKKIAFAGTNDYLFFVFGFLASAISGYFCIKYFLKFLQKYSFFSFALYRIALGILILVMLLNGVMPIT